MPEIIEDMPDYGPLRGSGARPTEDYATILDGQARRFYRGQDYQTTSDAYARKVRRYANRHGISVQVRLAPGHVDIQRRAGTYPTTDRSVKYPKDIPHA